MENSLHEFVNSKKATQEAYEYRNLYGPNVSQFEGEYGRSQFGCYICNWSGYKGPNYHQLQVNLLKDANKEVQLLVDSYRAIWAKVGCTIMGDGWTDNRQRTLINFLVYYPQGILFVKFVDASNIVKDATNLFLLFDKVIEWMGPLNVVHIVTDNATNYVAAGRLISQKHKHIDWSPCAAYCLNLILRISENFCNKPTIIGGVMDVIDQKVLKGKLDTMNEMELFHDQLGSFGRDLAYSSREVLQPDEWWRLHGYSALHLQKLAIQILSQTASSSGCQRN
ncbi:hypothetical protein CK203_090909 [Vitis vinifera]|uniref:DUF659 domain-containing protein n=1 Tax=Vitis vinifera TaxID=29760 RepID=A0A438CMW4_VITVI|nr:hypothetical protein CK203_090909 [Vitis vinifera]